MSSEDILQKKVETARRDFLWEYRDILTREQLTGGSTETTWLLRLSVRSLDISGVRLRADDLRLIGDVLAEGCALNELNLSDNLDFGKASLVAPDEMSLAKRDTLYLHS